MKRTFQTMLLSVFVILITASFCYAESVASSAGNFPYFHLGCLIMGGLTITSLKHRYPRIYLSEAVGSFAFYTIFVALFTTPVMETLKNYMS
jgi:hypothetical protein